MGRESGVGTAGGRRGEERMGASVVVDAQYGVQVMCCGPVHLQPV